jgi:regulator of protease activity HflC (stomatin/prohibitin superfamily)
MDPLNKNNHSLNDHIENLIINVQPGTSTITETKEIEFNPFDGCVILFLNIIFFFGSIAFIVLPIIMHMPWLLAIAIPCLILSFFSFFGLFTIQPGEAQVLVFYGTYKGTAKKSGFFWCNPLFTATRISLKSQNLNGQVIKVNDKKGNPIEIAIVVVWRVKNTARALFDVENYNNFVLVNSESAVRHLALMYPYDKAAQDEVSLRSGSDMITRELVNELHGRLDKAGIEVEEARITHLAYAPEIANAMLRRQQAEAVIEAREKIVQGAVSIVGHAIQSLRSNEIVDLKEEEKARLVSNMLVVLCSETQVHPVVNTN